MKEFHKISIRQKDSDKPKLSTGINTEVFIDNRKIKGITKLVYSVAAGGLAKIELELLGTVELDQLFSDSQIVINKIDISNESK